MVQVDVTYEGGLRARAVHGPSGCELVTDAPVDNHGKGESFSPTDLVASALGACMLTLVGIVSERHGWSVEGAKARVSKEMVADPIRRIGRLEVVISLPCELGEKERELLRKAALTCPVHKSLSAEMDIPVSFEFEG
ncbi:MAG: osmotically inducible protein OsmC [Deltaproteobacteria bacterium]|jgi:putative redox protein|nr:osmotically inducible protein OsmC [Deltaproteobacteria bacterium]